MKRYLWMLTLLVTCLILTACGAAPAVDKVTVTNDQFLTADANFAAPEIQAFLEQQNSPLAVYSETEEGVVYTAAEMFWIASQSNDYGLSPRALLTTLALENGLTWNKQGGLLPYLKNMAANLAASANAYEIENARESTLSGAKTITIGNNSNAATYAITQYLAPLASDSDQLNQWLDVWADTFQVFFQEDPKVAKAIAPPSTTAFLALPFDEPANSYFPITSFFDHYTPGSFNETTIRRFDGKSLSSAAFSTCWLGVTCYSGHNGTDISMPIGTPLYAAADGKVIYRYDTDGGLIIEHPNGYRTLYWHMDKILVKVGDIVLQRQLIGYSGNKGMSTGPHLHFGLRITSSSKDVDPYGWWGTSADPWAYPSQWMWQGSMTADHGTGQAQIFYTKYWYHVDRGYGGESFYTQSVNTTSASVNWGIWGVQIPRDGEYTVMAYWPKDSGSTESAHYQIYTADGIKTVVISQAKGGDQFTKLGTFRFKAGQAVVILTDLTNDAVKYKHVYYDAIQFVGQYEPTQFLPIIISGGN